MSNKIQNWEEISREEAFSKYGKKIEKVDFKLPDGKVSDFYIGGLLSNTLSTVKL